MRILITGGTGMIGRALAAHLANEDHEVIVPSRNPARGQSVLPESVRTVPWNGENGRVLTEWVDGTDAIVNLAGERLAGPNPFSFRWTASRKRQLLESRANVGKAVAQAIHSAENKPEVVIQGSGIDYYPHGDQIAVEDSPPGDHFLAILCSRHWEPSTEPIEELGVRRVIIRTAPVLNAKDGFLPPFILQTKLFVGGPMGGGRQWLSWVHWKDVVSAIRFLIETPQARGPFNLCSPHPLTNAQLSEVLGRVLRRPSYLPIPAFAFRLLFGEMSTTILKGVRAMPGRLEAMGYRFQFPEAEMALKDILR